MNASRSLFLGLASVLSACGNELDTATPAQPLTQSAITSVTDYANATLLPEDFTVYVNGRSVINWPAPGYEARAFPTVSAFKAAPGCYVACYTHNADNGVYEINPGVYVAGQQRLQGSYHGRICRPVGYETADISAGSGFAQQCSQVLPDACGDGACWAGGDTGGWFGL